MSVILDSSRYSFVNFSDADALGNGGCSPNIPICMPVYSPQDINFQVIVRVSGEDKDWFQVEAGDEDEFIWTIQAKVCLTCDDDEEPIGPNDFTYRAEGRWTKIVTDTTDVWIGNFSTGSNTALFDNLNSGDCYKLCFYKVLIDPLDPDTVVTLSDNIGCTQTCFQRIDDRCFTSYFDYRNHEDSFEFDYTSNPSFLMSVRLPCYLRDFQMPSEEKTYQKSDGSYVKLFERIDEEYELNIDWLPKSAHIKLKVLLAHDEIRIANNNDPQVSASPFGLHRIVCREKYDISWPTHPWQHAPAKTRIRIADPIQLLNSNCQ